MDVKKSVFKDLEEEFFFTIRVNQKGIFAASDRLPDIISDLKLKNLWITADGTRLNRNDQVLCASGDPIQVTLAEEKLLGLIGKTSGVATAAHNLVRAADGRIEVICGGWKKVFPEIKEDLRKAIRVGGAGIRMTESPFVYLDKNYTRMLGGIRKAVERAVTLSGRKVVVQLRGEFDLIDIEAKEAVDAGASILMVDTGCIQDLKTVVKTGIESGWRTTVKIGFSGGVTENMLESLIDAGADKVDIGRTIIDASILDFRLDVDMTVKY